MDKSAIRVMVFDLDDTLYPERDYAFSGFVAVARAFKDELGDPDDAWKDMRRLFDTEHRGRVFDRLQIERFGKSDAALVERMVWTFRNHAPAISLYPDVDPALDVLRGRCRFGLITDGRPEQQWAKIDALGLRPRLDHIIVTSEIRDSLPAPTEATHYGKPHPRPFEDMARRFHAAPAQCIYIADNPAKDFVAPNFLGWRSIRIVRPDSVYRDVKPVDGGEPHLTIESLSELIRWLN